MCVFSNFYCLKTSQKWWLPFFALWLQNLLWWIYFLHSNNTWYYWYKQIGINNIGITDDNQVMFLYMYTVYIMQNMINIAFIEEIFIYIH